MTELYKSDEYQYHLRLLALILIFNIEHVYNKEEGERKKKVIFYSINLVNMCPPQKNNNVFVFVR